MPTPITEVTKELIYKIPNSLYSKDDSKGRTNTLRYTGPDQVWVFVEEETGDLKNTSSPKTTAEDGPDIPSPAGHKKIKLTVEDNLFEMALIMPYFCETLEYTEKTEDLPDGNTITYADKMTISQAYELDTLTYDFENQKWNTPEYVDAPITWDDIISNRNGRLTASDGKIAPDMPEDIKNAWIKYRQALRDLPKTYGRGTKNEVEAWKVKPPEQPGDE